MLPSTYYDTVMHLPVAGFPPAPSTMEAAPPAPGPGTMEAAPPDDEAQTYSCERPSAPRPQPAPAPHPPIAPACHPHPGAAALTAASGLARRK